MQRERRARGLYVCSHLIRLYATYTPRYTGINDVLHRSFSFLISFRSLGIKSHSRFRFCDYCCCVAYNVSVRVCNGFVRALSAFLVVLLYTRRHDIYHRFLYIVPHSTPVRSRILYIHVHAYTCIEITQPFYLRVPTPWPWLRHKHTLIVTFLNSKTSRDTCVSYHAAITNRLTAYWAARASTKQSQKKKIVKRKSKKKMNWFCSFPPLSYGSTGENESTHVNYLFIYLFICWFLYSLPFSPSHRTIEICTKPR